MRTRVALAAALLLAACNVEINFDYEGEPQYSDHAPARVSGRKAVAIPPGGARTTAVGGGYTRLESEYQYEIRILNGSPEPGTWVHVHELFDHRDKLIRRHTIGPLVVPAGTQLTFRDTLQLPQNEKRSVHHEVTRTDKVKV